MILKLLNILGTLQHFGLFKEKLTEIAYILVKLNVNRKNWDINL